MSWQAPRSMAAPVGCAPRVLSCWLTALLSRTFVWHRMPALFRRADPAPHLRRSCAAQVRPSVTLAPSFSWQENSLGPTHESDVCFVLVLVQCLPCLVFSKCEGESICTRMRLATRLSAHLPVSKASTVLVFSPPMTPHAATKIS